VDGVAGPDQPAPGDRAHDPGEAHHGSRLVGVDDLLEQPGLEVVDLLARVAQACG